MKKPDYTDKDWGPLIQDRTVKWDKMKAEIEEEGWKDIPLRDTGDFISRLYLKPIHQGERRGIFIVCAGGGFRFKSSNEAKPVADYFYEKGINAAILDYHVDPELEVENETIKQAGEDALQAVRYLRFHADEFGILADKIAVGGFSAGGMTSGYAATRFDYGNLEVEKVERQVSSRPDAALILYGAFGKAGMVYDVSKYDYQKQAEMAKYDFVRNIRTDTCPMFIFQTHKDDPRYALTLGYELASKGVPFEMHTFENGGHGGALYNGKAPDSPYVPHTDMWPDIAADWLKMRGFF